MSRGGSGGKPQGVPPLKKEARGPTWRFFDRGRGVWSYIEEF